MWLPDYLLPGSLTGTWGDVLTTRGLPSEWVGLLSNVSRYKKNFSASMGIALIGYFLRSRRLLQNSINSTRGMPAGAMLQRHGIGHQSGRLLVARNSRSTGSRDISALCGTSPI
ncbi:hypothetical protein UP09_31485 [Bradyrhizobium sp. LTSP885]|nr:hypothetical protein UP09_31485 [Bradyrhizobium sp. LTSP885]